MSIDLSDIIYELTMGGAVSAGEDNDELVDHLVFDEIIRTKEIERVFRAVDRGHYYTEDYKSDAYRDTAWKDGFLHLSAPCIYSEVLEYIDLKPGLSFLNMGSGTGYLSTMSGLILGESGINHGIELHQCVVDYANKKLNEFKASQDMSKLDFCEPTFIVGNCLKIDPGSMRQYDRIYVGAAVLEDDEAYMKTFIKVGGILVMPLNDQLAVIKKVSENVFLKHYVYAVSFASLLQPTADDQMVKLPPISPRRLREICHKKVKGLINLKRCQEDEGWAVSPEKRLLTYYNLLDGT